MVGAEVSKNDAGRHSQLSVLVARQLRERVAKLEVQMENLSEKLDDTHKKVEEMHAILLQAKGARWVIVGLAGVAGLASGLVAKFMP